MSHRDYQNGGLHMKGHNGLLPKSASLVFRASTNMLSLASEWTDYFGQTPTSPVRHYDDDDSSCCSPEPLSPPRSPIPADDCAYGAPPDLPSLSLSPRSVADDDLDSSVNSGSSWMCVYDLDTLCQSSEFSLDLNPSSLFQDSLTKRTSGLMPYVVDLLNPTPDLEEEKKEDDSWATARQRETPIHTFHQPLEPDNTSSRLPPPQHRKKRKRRRSQSRTRVNLGTGRSVLVESSCDTVAEEEDTEQIEVIFLLVRKLQVDFSIILFLNEILTYLVSFPLSPAAATTTATYRRNSSSGSSCTERTRSTCQPVHVPSPCCSSSRYS